MPKVELKADVIDADAHVVEAEPVWNYLDAGEVKFRPTLATSPDNPQRQSCLSVAGNALIMCKKAAD